MFSEISKRLRRRFFTDEFIYRLLSRTLREHLHHDYEVSIVGELPEEVVVFQRQMQNMEELDEAEAIAQITAVTVPYRDVQYDDPPGYIMFSIDAIRRNLEDNGFLEGVEIVRELVMHECRHVDQFEFLRERGGFELIERVAQDLREVPYFDNIIEVDAYNYQFSGDPIDLEIVFAKYL